MALVKQFTIPVQVKVFSCQKGGFLAKLEGFDDQWAKGWGETEDKAVVALYSQVGYKTVPDPAEAPAIMGVEPEQQRPQPGSLVRVVDCDGTPLKKLDTVVVVNKPFHNSMQAGDVFQINKLFSEFGYVYAANKQGQAILTQDVRKQ